MSASNAPNAVFEPPPEETAPPPAHAPQDSVVIPPLRPDLVVTKQTYESRTYYVVKDPISLQYFRLTAEDYFLATLFDGKRNMGQVREAYVERFPHLRLEYSEEELKERVARFANDLALLQFLSIRGERLKTRYDAVKARKKSKGGLYTLVNKMFFQRFSVYDPDRLFAKMARPLWWIWTRTTMWVSIALIAAAVMIIFKRYDASAVMMSHFFSLNNIALIWVSTIIIKSIHELGHGLTCKHFGGEVHEVGVMLLVFTPYFFVNVSDSWVMPDRYKRILISAAGIYVELIIAAFATFLWAIVQPGPLQQILWNIIVIASISTIIFNANPLMRFDGYYILTDLIEVPNLQTKSRAFVTQQVKKLLFGRNYQDASMARLPLPKRRLGLFYFYAIASYIYGYFIIYSLTRYMAPHLPESLQGLASWLSALALVGWIVVPFWHFMKSLELNRNDMKPGGRLRRLGLIGGVALLLFAIMCVIPRQLVIKRAVAVELAKPEAVRPEVDGLIKAIYVREGDRVAPGAALAQMLNRTIEQDLAEAQTQLDTANAYKQRALAEDKPAQLREADTIIARTKKKLEDAQKNKDRLTLRTKSGGTVLTRQLELKLNRGLKLNEVFCEIAPMDSMLIKVPLTEKQVRYIKKDQPVELKAMAYPGKTLKGVIAEDPLVMLGADLPPALSAHRKGDVPTALDHQGKEVPLERTFEAEVRVNNSEGLLRQGMTGRVKIFAGRYPWWKLMAQSLLDLVSLDYRF